MEFELFLLIFFFFLIIIILSFYNFHKNLNIISLIIFISILTQIILSFINVFYKVLLPSEVDALDFITEFRKSESFIIGTEFFLNYVYLINNFSKYHNLIIHMINIIFNYITLLILKSYFKIFSINFKILTLIFILICFDPYKLIITSIPLRESFILFGSTILFYGVITNRSVITLIGFVFTLLWHKASFLISTIIYLSKFNFSKNYKFYFYFSVYAFFFYYLGKYVPDLRSFEIFKIFYNFDFIYYVHNYRLSGEFVNAKLTYTINQDNFILLLIKSFFYYNFLPLFNIERVQDLYLVFFSWLRLLACIFIIYNWKLMSNHNRTLFAIFMISSLIWSLGTTNFGTAARHHLTHDFFLIISFGRLFSELKFRKHFKHE